MSGKRTVKRCLVMIEYGEGDPHNGEVFDLTALALEMLPKSSYRACIGLEIEASRTYAAADSGRPNHELHIKFNGDAGNWIHGATHLDDVVNSALPDGERVKSIKRNIKRLNDKADQLRHDAMCAKLRQVAEIRHQHPIARFETPLPVMEDAK